MKSFATTYITNGTSALELQEPFLDNNRGYTAFRGTASSAIGNVATRRNPFRSRFVPVIVSDVLEKSEMASSLFLETAAGIPYGVFKPAHIAVLSSVSAVLAVAAIAIGA